MLLRPCSVRSSMHIYGIKEGLLQEFLGRRVLADVVYLGGGRGGGGWGGGGGGGVEGRGECSYHRDGEVKSKPTGFLR